VRPHRRYRDRHHPDAGDRRRLALEFAAARTRASIASDNLLLKRQCGSGLQFCGATETGKRCVARLGAKPHHVPPRCQCRKHYR
jgi:hypothetical protein